MGRLASQTAAHKLGQILGLLVIPIVVLWSIYFVKAKSEIDSLSREIAGVELALATIAAEPGSVDVAALEAAIGLVPASQGEVTANSSAVARVQKDQLTYLNKVYRLSGLALDGESQSHVLAETALILIPSLLEKIDQLTFGLDDAQMREEVAKSDPALFMMATGEAYAVLKRIEDNLAMKGLKDLPEITGAIPAFRTISQAVETAASRLSMPLAAANEKTAHLAKLSTAHRAFRSSAAMKLQHQVTELLGQRLSSRRVILWSNLVLLTLAGLASSLAGIGLAVLMMRSTLLRLDEVEQSRNESQAARHEAEQIAVRFTTINSDISRLNHELAVKMKELKEAQDELIKKGRLEQLGQLTATIAHEIRNPLGAIRTSAFLLERKTSKLGEDLAGHLQRINNGVNRCDTIISQLLDFSRTKEVNSSLIQLDDWLAKIVREEAQRLPDNVYIECSLGLESMKVAFDPARLQRAVINLLSNASEALAQQDPQERPNGQHACIWVTTLLNGDFASIRVSDNGPGIASEYLQKIREPLFTTKSFGTGLGIPAVEQIAAQHGGRLDISSELGAGAVFTLNLPINRAKEIDHAA